jgi:hypothetical protein
MRSLLPKKKMPHRRSTQKTEARRVAASLDCPTLLGSLKYPVGPEVKL